MSRICAIIQKLESTEFVADFVTTAGAMGTDDEDDDERKSENGKVNQRSTISQVKTENYPPPPSLRSSSPLSQGDSQLQLCNAITHFLPLRQAGVPRRGEGVDKPFAPFA